MIENWIGEKFV